MEKEEFRRLLKEHGQISLGLNAFDRSEITATYSIDEQGNVYEQLCVVDDNSDIIFNINDDAKLQDFYDEVLCNVVSHSYESHFERCVEYIKEHLEHWEIEQGWDYIGKRMGLPNGLVGRIYDLIDDFTEDNDLTDDWWNDYDAEDFFMEIDNE